MPRRRVPPLEQAVPPLAVRDSLAIWLTCKGNRIPGLQRITYSFRVRRGLWEKHLSFLTLSSILSHKIA